jgi:hypothetical protein
MNIWEKGREGGREPQFIFLDGLAILLGHLRRNRDRRPRFLWHSWKSYSFTDTLPVSSNSHERRSAWALSDKKPSSQPPR